MNQQDRLMNQNRQLIIILTSRGMASYIKVIFDLNTTQGSRIKQMSIHPIKNWVGVINQNNTFSLWNFKQKILIKSFSCNTLEDNKNVEIKQIVFFDKYSLCNINDSKNMKNNIIFVTNSKLIFYDYIADTIRQTSQKDLQQKSIRKVCVYSETKICIAMSDNTFKVLDTRQSQAKGSMSIRTIRGFHQKPITWIFAYSQNYNQMPRVISASDQDGMMACWNIQMILKGPPNVQSVTPSFKFQSSSKKGKQSIGNEEILSLEYDPSNYKLITLNEHYIRIWSTMTGIEVKRIKNSARYKQIIFFNHFTFPTESFIAHSKNTKLMVVRTTSQQIVLNQQIELKNFFSYYYVNNNQDLNLNSHLYSLPQHPEYIFLLTNFNMAVIQIDKFYNPPYGFHHSFSTRLSTINSRDFINKSEGQLRKNISSKQLKNIKFEQDIISNLFFLSVEEAFIYFNLLQIQYSTMLYQTRKYKIQGIDLSSPLLQTDMRSKILINFEGNQIIIFNKALFYYEVYQSINSHEKQDLLGHSEQISNKIDFFSKFQLINMGFAREVVYHQYKNQYAVIGLFDKDEKLIEPKPLKEKKGSKNRLAEIKSITAIASKHKILIYEKKNNKTYQLVQKSSIFSSKIYGLFCFGNFYGYSASKQNNPEVIEFISSEKGSIKEIQGNLISPQNVYVSYCESIYILSYEKYFIVLKIQENGSMLYFRTFQYPILNGYFWEKYFFFITENSLYFLQILNEQSILIKIADSSKLNIISKIINDIEDDDFQPEYQLLPVGQQQILTIVNMSLVLISENGTPTLISLNGFPYIAFCLQIASGVLDQSKNLYNNASRNISNIMKETMTNYGLIAPDLYENEK